jgi:hypothetical protein
MSKDYNSIKNPGLFLGIVIFGAWLLCWIGIIGRFSSIQLAGIPVITWGMIVIGVAAVIASVLAIPALSKWEDS